MAKQTCIFIYVAAASIIQSIVVLIVDFPVSMWLAKYDTWLEFAQHRFGGIIYRALYSYYVLNLENALLALSVTHLIVHLTWVVSSCILLFFLIKPDPRKSSLVLQFAIITLLVSLCDICATIYTAIYIPIQIVQSILLPNYDIADMCFFPLFFSKVVVFLIHNIIVGVLMVRIYKKLRAEQLHRQQPGAIFGRDNPVIFHQGPPLEQQPQQQQHHNNYQQQPQKNDLVDNFYNYPSGPAVISTSHEQVAEPINYKSPIYRPPYLEELQRHSIQTPPKFTVPLPNPDY